MAIDLSSFDKALATLEAGLRALSIEPANAFIRDACIQRFEYCYELSVKTLRRYLEATEATPTRKSALNFPNLIRLGYQRELLRAEWSEWKGFRDARNITSHVYDETKASLVLLSIPPFLAEAKFLLAEIAARQAQEP